MAALWDVSCSIPDWEGPSGKMFDDFNFSATLGTVWSRGKPMYTEPHLGTTEHKLCFDLAALPLRCLGMKALVGAFAKTLMYS